MEKNQKGFILNSPLLCLSTPHKPKIPKEDKKTIAGICCASDQRYNHPLQNKLERRSIMEVC